jgi:hypothetical protein
MSTLLLSSNITSQSNVLTIEAGERAAERWQVFSGYVKGYWQGIVNLTNQIAAQQP